MGDADRRAWRAESSAMSPLGVLSSDARRVALCLVVRSSTSSVMMALVTWSPRVAPGRGVADPMPRSAESLLFTGRVRGDTLGAAGGYEFARTVPSLRRSAGARRFMVMPTFGSKQGDVHWERAGSGPPVVLCHGTPWSSRVWDATVAALEAEWTVYRWDLVGFGRSEMRAGQCVSLAVQGEVFADLLASWELDRPAVVAHDVGGAVALRAHLVHGVAFGSLTLIDAVAVAPWGSPFFRLVRDHADVFAALPGRLHRALVEEYIRGACYRRLREDQLELLVTPWLGRDGQAAFYRQIAQADQRDTDEIEPRYPTLRLPTAVIWGGEDPWVPLASGRQLAASIPGATLSVVEGAGHLLQFEAEAELIRAIRRGLDEMGHPDPPEIEGSSHDRS
jgi:pimeloyl-ACP methyl ester carboxylesterase